MLSFLHYFLKQKEQQLNVKLQKQTRIENHRKGEERRGEERRGEERRGEERRGEERSRAEQSRAKPSLAGAGEMACWLTAHAVPEEY
jgi:hypothetical protein